MKHGEREGDERQEGKGWRHREGEKGGREGSKEGEREKERGTKYKVQSTNLRTYIYIKCKYAKTCIMYIKIPGGCRFFTVL